MLRVLSFSQLSPPRTVLPTLRSYASYRQPMAKPPPSNGPRKRRAPGPPWTPRPKKQKKESQAPANLAADIQRQFELLGITQDEAGAPPAAALELPADVEVIIDQISSTGDGLGHAANDPGRAYIVPFTAPGDTVLAHAHRYDTDVPNTVVADLLSITTPSPLRDDSLIRCRYFSRCSGCQLQMLPYDEQLAYKKRVVEHAYRDLSGVPAALIPSIGDTVGSPLQYGYRTKLTPHFDGPQGMRRTRRKGETPRFADVPPIGFMLKNTRKTIDIEDCPIGTPAVQMGLQRERARVTSTIDTYSKGATILLRESTQRVSKRERDLPLGPDQTAQHVVEPAHLTPKPNPDSQPGPNPTTAPESDTLHIKTCVSDNNATITEYINDFRLDNLANSFFQNNNSILPRVISHIQARVRAADPSSSALTHLVDAYCGCGFFTVTLSPLFRRAVGIDIDERSIDYARRNARHNGLREDSVSFLAADANGIFDPLRAKSKARLVEGRGLVEGEPEWNPESTVVLLDPPRKGCDEGFLRQLLEFAPALIVYVSCNVHTQARDVGVLLKQGGDEAQPVYGVESITGFDFFPQTAHVESVAVLKKRRAS